MFLPVTICRQRVAHMNRLSEPPDCLLTNGSKVTLASLIAAHITPGDDLSFPLPNSSSATAEILVTKNSLASSGRDLYQAPIGYVTQPKKDKRDEFFVAAGGQPGQPRDLVNISPLQGSARIFLSHSGKRRLNRAANAVRGSPSSLYCLPR